MCEGQWEGEKKRRLIGRQSSRAARKGDGKNQWSSDDESRVKVMERERKGRATEGRDVAVGRTRGGLLCDQRGICC